MRRKQRRQVLGIVIADQQSDVSDDAFDSPSAAMTHRFRNGGKNLTLQSWHVLYREEDGKESVSTPESVWLSRGHLQVHADFGLRETGTQPEARNKRPRRHSDDTINLVLLFRSLERIL